VCVTANGCRSEGANVQQLDSVIPGDGLWDNVSVRDVMDTMAERFCYIYG